MYSFRFLSENYRRNEFLPLPFSRRVCFVALFLFSSLCDLLNTSFLPLPYPTFPNFWFYISSRINARLVLQRNEPWVNLISFLPFCFTSLRNIWHKGWGEQRYLVYSYTTEGVFLYFRKQWYISSWGIAFPRNMDMKKPVKYPISNLRVCPVYPSGVAFYTAPLPLCKCCFQNSATTENHVSYLPVARKMPYLGLW